MTPYSTGTWGSRCDGDGGRRGRHRLPRTGRARRAHRRATAAARSGDGACCRTARCAASTAASPCSEIAHTWYRRPQDLPPDVDPGGLEVTSGYKPQRDTGTFSYAAPCRGGRGRSRPRRRRDPRLRHRRGRRRAGQSDGGRRPDLWRPRAGHRHRAVRGDAVRRVRPAARVDACRLSAAGRRPKCRRRGSITWRRRRPTPSSA